MAKDDVVSAQVVSVQAAQVDALKAGLGAAYDAGMLDGKAAGDPAQLKYSQEDLDAAVAQAKTQAEADVQSQLEPQIDDLKGKVSALQADDDAKTAIIASIDGLLHPAPVPVPAPGGAQV